MLDPSSVSEGSGGEMMDWIRSWEEMMAVWVCYRPRRDSG
jgi:hypothetical protein